MGRSIPPSTLTEVVDAIAAFDESWQAPQPLQARRAFVDNWFSDNEGKPASYSDTYQMTQIALERVVPRQEIEEARERGATSDFHVYLTEDGDYRIHANRTHSFVRVGHRYLLTSDEHWLELDVTEIDGEVQSSNKGRAAVVAASAGSSVLAYDLEGEDEPGSLWAACRGARLL